jgi:hypothetical protein
MLKLKRSIACKNAPLKMRKYTFDNKTEYTIEQLFTQIFTFDEFKLIDRDCEIIILGNTLYIMVPENRTIETTFSNFKKGKIEDHFNLIKRKFII